MRDLPPPLPPGERTVGQLVAEAIRLYGDGFWKALPLGLPLAAAAQLNLGRDTSIQVAVLTLFAPFFSAAFVRAILVAGARPVSRRRIVLAWALGTAVWIPAPALLRLYIIPALAWLAFWGLSVPAVLLEGLGLRAALGRAHRLARAHFVHALGSLCTLVLVVELSSGVLGALLHSQADATRRVAGFGALLVLSPLLYLGSALLYFDQAARVGAGRPARRGGDARARLAAEADPAGDRDARAEP